MHTKPSVLVGNDLDWFCVNIEDLSVFKIAYYSFTTADIMWGEWPLPTWNQV